MCKCHKLFEQPCLRDRDQGLEEPEIDWVGAGLEAKVKGQGFVSVDWEGGRNSLFLPSQCPCEGGSRDPFTLIGPSVQGYVPYDTHYGMHLDTYILENMDLNLGSIFYLQR